MTAIAENIDYVLSTNAKLKDTEKHLVRIINQYHFQVSDLAKKLRGKNDLETAKNIWAWVRENIKYQPDEPKIEQLRRPARILEDKKGDCDCMTILISSLLIENNITPYAKIVSYPEIDDFGNYKTDIFGNYKSAGFSHIYTFFYYKNKPIYLDTVPEIKEFNTEHQPIVKFKILKIMELHELAGTGVQIPEHILLGDFYNPNDNTILQESLFGKVVINNGSQIDENELRNRIYVTAIKNFVEALKTDSQTDDDLQEFANHKKEIQIANAVLDAYEKLTTNELIQVLENAIDLSNYDDLYEDFLTSIENEVETPQMYGFEIVEDFEDRIAQRDPEIIENLLGRVHRTHAQRKSDRQQKRHNRPHRDHSKRNNTLKKYGFAPVRVAFLQVVRMNFLKIAEQLALGLSTWDKVSKLGVDKTTYDKFHNASTKFCAKWKQFGGDERKLNKAIFENRKVKQQGLGIAVTSAMISSATAVIVAFKKIFKGLKMPKLNNNSTSKGKTTTTPSTTTTPNTTTTVTTTADTTPSNQNFMQKMNSSVKTYIKPTTPAQKKKQKIAIGVIVGIVIVVVAFVWYLQHSKKAKLSGVTKKRKPAKRKTTAKRKPVKRKTTAKRKPVKRKTTAKRKPVKRKTTAKRKPTVKKITAKRKPVKRKTTAKRKPTTRRKKVA